jgi:hypothetical protein
MSTSWLSLVPVCEPFAYRGNLICADCAKQVRSELEGNNVGDTGDTNDFPQDGSNEADSPQHCGYGDKCVNAVKIPNGRKIGCPLNTQLTEDGIAYTRDKIAENILFGTGGQKGIGRLWLHLYGDSIGEVPLIQLTKDATILPAQLSKALTPLLKSPHTNLLSETYTDLNYIYGGAIWGGFRESLTLWRLSISDTGDFTTLDQVLLPSDMPSGESLEAILADAISESAWE